MGISEFGHRPVDKGTIAIAWVLLLGVVVLGAGIVSCNRIPFYFGLLITLTGIITGIYRFFIHGDAWPTKR